MKDSSGAFPPDPVRDPAIYKVKEALMHRSNKTQCWQVPARGGGRKLAHLRQCLQEDAR